ncbi:MAG TPA: hypothetical protein VGD65_26510 [Chryseosolibacter sp.]
MIVTVQPVDMFPHTMHVENIVSLVRKQLRATSFEPLVSGAVSFNTDRDFPIVENEKI